MKTIVKTLLSIAIGCGSAMAQGSTMAPPENPATGIWIQQVGDIVPHASTKATLYYTKYSQNDRVKDLNYYYDGAGYLQLLGKETLCTSNDGMKGADGIVHHPDGDLLVAAQGPNVHKISKTAKKDGTNGGKCVVKTSTPATSTEGFWHLMMDPNQEWLWAAGIPGYLYRFSTKIDSNNIAARNFADKGYRVELVPKSTDRVQHHKLATLIWDKDGNAFFTYSNYLGGGCETNANTGNPCSDNQKKSNRAGAYFGYITDTTWTKVTASNKDSIGGEVNDSVITKLGTTILIDSLEGAHGGTYDPYSETIFVFGGSRIVQIRPYKEGGKMKAEVVAFIDLRQYFFQEDLNHLTLPRTNDGGYVGWRLDQGTVDGMGHLFVASNTGHLVFVDYAANPNKYINDNVLVHLQWIDNFLDDLAPLSGAGVVRTGANTGSDNEVSSSSIGFSSSRVVYEESSSSVKSSSSSRPGSSSGGNPGTSSSGNNPGTSSSGNNPGTSSSGDNPGTSSSGENPGSSGNDNSSSSGENPGSSGSDNSSSSGENPGSSGNDNSSSSGENPGSSGSDNSSSSGGNSGSSSSGTSSSSRKTGSEDIDFGSSSSRVYVGFEDYDLSSSGGGIDFYPSDDKFEKGDSIVTSATILLPVDSTAGAGIIKIGENYYMEENNPVAINLDLHVNSGLDSAQVGQVVALTLDPDKVKEYFGDVDSLTFATASGLTLIDPKNPNASDTIRVNADGSVTIWVTADSVVHGGSIIVHDPGSGTTIIIDNINFYDPIPDAELGYIKDTDGDQALDYVEIILKDTLISELEVSSVVLVVKGDTLKPKSKPGLNETRDRISIDVADLDFPEKFPEDAYAVITYKNIHDDVVYTRDAYIVEVGSRVIKDAFAIRDVHGKDSLFIEFNIDLIPKDLSTPEMLVLLKQEGKRYGFNLDQISNIYMPTRNMVILVGENMGLKGENRDSVSLHPGVQFNNLRYLTSDEYEREVPIKVIDRLPTVVDVEYRDTDGDGVLDQIVTNFSGPLTETEKNMLYATYPWYSERGLMIQLQAQPADLKFDGKDSSRVIWNVVSTTPIAKGVTSISESLPQATIYTYYDVLGQTFVNEESAPLVDKMSPIVSAVTLSYGQKADTLIVYFSEIIKYKDLEGRDFFSYIHGKDTIDILPKDIDWASDGMSAKLIIDGSVSTILPGDSLMVVRGEKSVIQDNFGNVAGDDPSPVVIAGLLNHLVDATNMGTFDGEDDVLQTLSSVNLRYMPGSTTKEDLEKEGALGQLVQLGERFVPQLLDRAQISADGTVDPSVLDSLDPEKVFITFVVNYYDHLGQYVNDTTILVPCNSPKFGGNCLVSDKKLFVNWNFKDHRGRFVGTGVYTVQFKMVVRYEKKKIEEEIKDKWGVRRKKHKK
jgi:hypothetical protein